MVELLKDVKYKDFTFIIKNDLDTWKSYLQVEWDGKDSITGLPRRCKGRKWWLSSHMTKSELVQTALKAVLTIEEHEAREAFLYRGRAIFGPHYNVDKLVELCDQPGALDVRT